MIIITIVIGNTINYQELKSIKAAYNKLLSEKQKSDDVIMEINKLKKELTQAHKVCNKPSSMKPL